MRAIGASKEQCNWIDLDPNTHTLQGRLKVKFARDVNVGSCVLSKRGLISCESDLSFFFTTEKLDIFACDS